MKKLYIYLTLVGTWSFTYSSAALRQTGSVIRQASHSIIAARAAVAAQVKSGLSTKNVAQQATKKEKPFIVKVDKPIYAHSTDQQIPCDELRNLAKRGQEVRNLHEQSRKIVREDRLKLIEPYLKQHISTLNAQQICMLTELLPEKDQSEWSVKVLDTYFETCVKDTNDIIILLDTLPYDLKKKYTFKIITDHFDMIEIYHLSTLLDNLSIEERKKILFSKIESGISLEKFSVLATYFSPFLSEEEHKKALTAFYKQFIGHEPTSTKSPLFCPAYFIRHFEHLPITYGHTPIQELLPEIAAHTAKEHEKGNVVFYHARNTFWHFLTAIYKELYALKHNEILPESYIPLRFTETSPLTEADYKELITKGNTLGTYFRAWLFFLNMIPIANQDEGSNSWRFFIRNFDYTMHRVENVSLFIEKMFCEFNLEHIYKAVSKDFETLYRLHEVAVKAEGNYGQMLVFSVKPQTATHFIYSASAGGVFNPLIINRCKTTDPVVIAKHFTQVPRENQFALILTSAVLSRNQTDITIKAFDPTFYKKTPNADIVEAQFKKVMEKIRILAQYQK